MLKCSEFKQIRTNTVVAKLGEEIKSLRRKLVELESQGGNEEMLREMLEKKGKELANLQVRAAVEKKLAIMI